MNKKVLRRLRKITSDGEVVTLASRLFQTREAATTYARSPMVALLVAATISAAVKEERRQCWDSRSAKHCKSRARYEGAVPCKQR